MARASGDTDDDSFPWFLERAEQPFNILFDLTRERGGTSLALSLPDRRAANLERLRG